MGSVPERRVEPGHPFVKLNRKEKTATYFHEPQPGMCGIKLAFRSFDADFLHSPHLFSELTTGNTIADFAYIIN